MVRFQDGRAASIVPIGLVGAVLAIGLATMPAQCYPGDPFAMREEAMSILRGRLSVDPQIAKSSGLPGQFFVENGNCYYSKYGLMNSVMNLPPLAIEWIITGSLPDATRQVRLLLLNVYNVALSVLIAVVMYRLAGMFTPNYLARAVYVLTAFYGTFLWNYLRAQAGEIFQVLFFLGFYESLSCFARAYLGAGDWSSARPIGRLYLAWACLAALILTRISYLLLMAMPFALAAYAVTRTRSDGAVRRIHPLHLIGPAAVILSLVGSVNYIKFGSPFLTGYHQWQPEWHRLTGSMISGLRGFLLDPQRSIFIHFPILVLALPGVRRFASRFPLDTYAIVGVAIAYLLLISKLPSWRGENSYGPRYLLFILPVLSLPFTLVLEAMIVHSRAVTRVACFLACLVVVIPSVWSQVEINRLPFMAFYDIRQPLETDPRLDNVVKGYFTKNFSLFYFEIARSLNEGMPLPYSGELKRVWTAERVDAHRDYVNEIMKNKNYCW